MEAFHTALSELGSKPHLTSLFSSPGSEDILEKLPFSIHVIKLNGRENYFGSWASYSGFHNRQGMQGE